MTPLTPTPVVQGFFDAATHTVSYIVHDPATKAAMIIDPVLGFTPANAHISTEPADILLDQIQAGNLDLHWLVDTHAHADHLSAVDYLKGRTGVPTVIGAKITEVQEIFIPLFEDTETTPDGSVFDLLVNNGDTLPLGNMMIKVMHTPGHTPACLTYVIGDAAFVGDTLFMPDYGTARADFPGGDAATLYKSIRRILDLPGTTRIFVGHDYLPAGRDDFIWETNVAEQSRDNIHVHDGISQDDFVRMREARDKTLSVPTLILPSLQVNIRGGKLPSPTDKGHVYFKLPVNAI